MMLIVLASIQPWESYQKRVSFASMISRQHKKFVKKTMGDVHEMLKALYSIKRALHVLRSSWHK